MVRRNLSHGDVLVATELLSARMSRLQGCSVIHQTRIFDTGANSLKGRLSLGPFLSWLTTSIPRLTRYLFGLAIKMAVLHEYDYVFAIGTLFAMLDAYNNGASEYSKPSH
jgi:hypothetical protein